MLLNLLQKYIVNRRAPDLNIGGAEQPYIRRWFVIPRNRFFNIYLHNMLRDDDDRAFHDHPWINVSFVMAGGYIEHTPHGTFRRFPGQVIWRLPRSAHRLALAGADSWSLFITGPRIREWGFHCPQGWVHWRRFTSGPNGETVGLGCDQ